MTLRLQTPLDDHVESAASEVIHCCLVVHRELGPALLESTYQRALSVLLTERGVSHNLERSVAITFRGQTIAEHRLDLVVDGCVIVELKAVERLSPLHVAQCLAYLRASELRLALLVNFNVPLLKQGLRRIVL